MKEVNDREAARGSGWLGVLCPGPLRNQLATVDVGTGTFPVTTGFTLERRGIWPS